MDLLISMAVNVLIESVKNPAKKAQLRKAVLKVFKTILGTYGSDPDFIASMQPYVTDTEV
jgi:hypothetical protein